jgi:hypothetical protein
MKLLQQGQGGINIAASGGIRSGFVNGGEEGRRRREIASPEKD